MNEKENLFKFPTKVAEVPDFIVKQYRVHRQLAEGYHSYVRQPLNPAISKKRLLEEADLHELSARAIEGEWNPNT